MTDLVSSVTVADRNGVDVPFIVNGYRWVNTFEGFAGMATRQVVFPATGMHGRRNRTRYRDGKTGVISGVIHAVEGSGRTWTEYTTIARALSGAVDTDRLVKWSVGGLDLQTTARLVDLVPALQVGPNIVRYQATFDLADPRAYSQVEQETTTTPLASGGGGDLFGGGEDVFPDLFNSSIGGMVSVTNDGTVDTPALFIFHGGLVDPVLTLDENRLISINGTIPAGQALYVYTAPERRVLLNDSLNRVGLIDFAVTRWFEIPPGTHVMRLTATSFSGSTPGVEIRTRHAYE